MAEEGRGNHVLLSHRNRGSEDDVMLLVDRVTAVIVEYFGNVANLKTTRPTAKYCSRFKSITNVRMKIRYVSRKV